MYILVTADILNLFTELCTDGSLEIGWKGPEVKCEF